MIDIASCNRKITVRSFTDQCVQGFIADLFC